MAGSGGAWGSRESLLHPRDKHGRFRSKWKMAAGVVDKLMAILDRINFRTFKNDQEATDYIGKHRAPNLSTANLSEINAAIRSGKSGGPGEAALDKAMKPLPEDVILSRVVPPEAFGLNASTLDAGMEEYTGKLIADKGFSPTSIGTPMPHQGPTVTMVIATPKGTKAAIPDGISREVVLDKGQPLRITKVQPDGKGGQYVMAVATPKGESSGKPSANVPGEGAAPSPATPSPAQAPAAPQVTTPGESSAPSAPNQAPNILPAKKQGRPAGPPPPPRTDGHVAENVGGTGGKATAAPTPEPPASTPKPEVPQTPEVPPTPEAPAAPEAPSANRPRGLAERIDQMRQANNPAEDILAQDAQKMDQEAKLQRAALPRRAYGDVAARIAEMEGLNDPPGDIADEIERAVREHGDKVHPDQFGLMANNLLRVADDYRAGDVSTARRRMTAILRDNDIKMGPKPNTRVRFDPRIHGKPNGMNLEPGDQVDMVLPEVVWEPRGHEPRVLAKAAVIPAKNVKGREVSRERRALEGPGNRPLNGPANRPSGGVPGKAQPPAERKAAPKKPPPFRLSDAERMIRQQNAAKARNAAKASTPSPAKKAAPAAQIPDTDLGNQRVLDLRKIAKDEHVRVPLGAKKEEIRQLILDKRKNKAAGIGTPPIKRNRPAKAAAKPDTELKNQRVDDLKRIAKQEGIRIPANLRTKEAIRQHILAERKGIADRRSARIKKAAPSISLNPKKATPNKSPAKAVGKAAVPKAATPAPVKKAAPKKKLPGVVVKRKPAKQLIDEGAVSLFKENIDAAFKHMNSEADRKAMLNRVQVPILKELAKKWGVHIPAGDAKPAIISKILGAKNLAAIEGGGTRLHGQNLRGLRALARDEKIRIPSWMKDEGKIRQYIQDVRKARVQAAQNQANSIVNMPAGHIFPARAQKYHTDVSNIQHLVKSVEGGHVKERGLAGGAIGDTRIRTGKDGTKWVWKRDNKNTTDGEQISNELGRHLGLAVPGMYRTEHDAVNMEFVDGEVARNGLPKKPAWSKYKSFDEVYQSDDMKRMALLDALVVNTDRHRGNWMLGDNGRIIPIDHGFTFGHAFGKPTERPIARRVSNPASAQAYMRGTVANAYRDYKMKNILFDGANDLKDNDFTQADMRVLRQRILGMRPMASKLGQDVLIENMLARLELIAQHAKGTKNLIA